MSLYKRKNHFWLYTFILCFWFLVNALHRVMGVNWDVSRPEQIITNVHTSEKVIALTFDDGPDPVFTPKILRILVENNVRGTFFVVGKQLEQYPEIATMIVKNHNEIANHTYTHPNMRLLTGKKLDEEIKKNHQVIFKATGIETSLFRPPQGVVNESIITAANNNGYQVVLWSWRQDSRDWSRPGVNKIIQTVLKKEGNIVIFHDCGGNRSQTIKALQPIIDGLKEENFQMVTVSELLQKEDRGKISISLRRSLFE